MTAPRSASLTAALVALTLATLAPSSRADTARIPALKDNTLYESATGALSNGAGTAMFAGRTAQGTNYRRRALVAFDVAAYVPAGATITAAVLKLSLASAATAVNLDLHRALQSWGEGTSAATGGQGTGAASTTGDATWLHRFYDTSAWNAAGGDFATTVSATVNVSVMATYSWSSVSMVTDVQDWLDTPAGNAGWVVAGDEATSGSAVKLNTREVADTTLRPVLELTYTPAPAAVGDATGPREALRVFPNPSAGITEVAVTLAHPAGVRLEVLDVRGRRVATLVDGVRFGEGTQRIGWDGRSSRGGAVPPGVYFVRMSAAGGEVRTARVLRIR
jgi:hypothetical protein